LTDLFWNRWKSHYLSELQQHSKWNKVRSFSVGDVVLLKDEQLCRGDWRLCRVSDLIVSHDGLVRRVRLQIGDRSPGRALKKSFLERPVHKLVLLIRSDI
jgi:hypothetical protein